MIEVYADGSCLGNGQIDSFGGWSFVALRGGKILYQAHGAEKGTSNNRMELTAVIEALTFLYLNFFPIDEKIRICTDSAYVCNAVLKGWANKWLRNGFKTQDGGEVKNKDLWDVMIFYSKKIDCEYMHVKGHAGHKYNEMCDKLARGAAQEMRKKYACV